MGYRCKCGKCMDCLERKEWERANEKYELVWVGHVHKHLGISKNEWVDYMIAHPDLRGYRSGAYTDGGKKTDYALGEILEHMKKSNYVIKGEDYEKKM